MSAKASSRLAGARPALASPPVLSAISTGNDDKLKAAAACSGSLVAIANACSKAATPDACSATNSKCAWTEGVCHHADLPTTTPYRHTEHQLEATTPRPHPPHAAAVLATVGSWTNLTAYAVAYLQLAINEL
ncbi:hypothetical protein Rsub_06127 [Raphidocelis subcapitata]|uniref:Uncharacterized protein n=1 Tax=Raphidocelis subcapitata TaxID=307507 RepID=A0A2V0P9M3_9CHLO|nr:hypothetical protein Rsub_06127 [Raphidocelis subcapitata]|eukprot:GBF93795.1 hypothetical protein Rsub_06127 [Raphidocelis subcapitata]